MKLIKVLQIALVLIVLAISTSCNPEQVNPKQTDGATQTQDPIIID